MFPILEIVTKYGFLGLNLFFIISGFVILFSALNKPPINFAVSRMDRLFPIYWVAVTLTMITTIVFTDSTISTYHYLMNLTMLNNYFNIPDMDVVYWTLHAELKFYFLIFMLILIKQIKNVHIWIPIWLITAIVYFVFKQPFFMGWFISPFYSSYFISGILFCLIYSHGFNWKYFMALLISMGLSVSYSIIQVDGFIRQPTLIDKIVTPLAVVILYAILFAVSIKRFRVKGSKWLLIAGSITYPMFLLHVRIGRTFYDLLSSYMSKYSSLLAISFCMIMISFLVYFFVERIYTGRVRKVLLSILPNRSL